MNWKWLLFDLEGRINRSKYWLAVVAIFVCFIVVGAIVASVIVLGANSHIEILFGIICYIGLIWVGVAVAVKRLHDRAKTAWWLVLFYGVPAILDGSAEALGPYTFAGALLGLVGLVISIWAFIELGCLRGTDGPNQYGPNPLAGELAPAAQ